MNTLLERIDDLFRFTQDKKVDGDNNLAERGLRKVVIIRKISNGSRSDSGAEILEVLLSVVETARLQKCKLKTTEKFIYSMLITLNVESILC